MQIFSGKDTSILIKANYNFFGDWTSFATCYSIIKFLPDAEICIHLNKPKIFDKLFFMWAGKLNILLQSDPKNTELFILKPLVILVREIAKADFYDIDKLTCDAKSNDFKPFVSYETGCGKFVVSEWIYKEECPFSCVDKLVGDSMTINELQVLKLWKQASLLYKILSKG
jgi:hypothetical protein